MEVKFQMEGDESSTLFLHESVYGRERERKKKKLKDESIRPEKKSMQEEVE